MTGVCTAIGEGTKKSCEWNFISHYVNKTSQRELLVHLPELSGSCRKIQLFTFLTNEGKSNRIHPGNCSAAESFLTVGLCFKLSHQAINTTLLHHKEPPILITLILCLQLLTLFDEYLPCIVQQKVFVIIHTMHFILFISLEKVVFLSEQLFHMIIN